MVIVDEVDILYRMARKSFRLGSSMLHYQKSRFIVTTGELWSILYLACSCNINLIFVSCSRRESTLYNDTEHVILLQK